MNNSNTQNKPENTNNNIIDSTQLNKILKNTNELNEELKTHIVLNNKIILWNKNLAMTFPTIKSYVFLGFSAWWLCKIIMGDSLSKIIIDFALNRVTDNESLLTICVSINLFYWIKNKYK